MTERALVQNDLLMTAAKEDALEVSVREHARLVYRIAYSVSRNHYDAEDAAQETFMRIVRYRRKLEGIRDPKTWIARIAWRTASQLAKRRRRLSMNEMKVADACLSAPFDSVEDSAAREEMFDLLASLIAALPASLRDVTRLSTVRELAPAEIALVLEISEGSVRSRLFRARQILRDKLQTLERNHGSTRSRS